MSQQFTDTKTLNQLIEQHNPFSSKVTAQHSVWSNEYSGVAAINQNAFNQVLQLIDDVDTKKSETEGAVIIGERGLGKTQLLARLHHHLSSNNKAFFVYMGEYDNLDAIKPEFLQALVYSLKREYMPNVTQWQALAAEMYFEARGGDRPFTIEHLVKQFPSVLSKNPNLINSWTSGIAHKIPDVKNIFLIRAILWTLLPESAPFAAMWLAGQKLSEDSAKTLGLPVDRDGDSFSYTCDLLNLITRYKTVVFCFDELDAPQVNTQMLTTVQVVLGLAKDLYNIKRTVILLAVFPQTFSEDINLAASSIAPKILAAKDRVSHKIELEMLDVQASLSLVEHRLQQFYKHHNVIPPDPFYPFEKNELSQNFAGEKAPSRKILRWCEEKWIPKPPIVIEGQTDPPPDGGENGGFPPDLPLHLSRVEEYYQQHLQDIQSDFDRIDANLLDNSEKITKALRFAFDHLINQVVDEMQIFAVIDEQEKAYKDIVPFKVKVRKAENKKGHYAFIGIAVIQKTGVALTNALEKLVKFNEPNQTRACLIRSEDIGGNKARDYTLTIMQNGGEWIQFHTDHIIPILALQSLLKKSEEESQDNLTEPQIWEYVAKKGILTDNLLLKEIVSKPDTKIPKDPKWSDLTDLASKLERIPNPTPTSSSFVVAPNGVVTDLKDIDFS